MHTARLFRAMGQLGIGLIVWLAANSVVHADAIELQHERNVDIAMRDGVRLKADVFRPVKDGKYPVILSVTAYQKDMLWIPPESHNARPGPYQNWETPNPERWVPEGYVLVRLDTRGTGQSPGLWNPASPEEAVDVYDTIEWLGEQPWSNGNVGMTGISYMALHQWTVASMGPPSLKAIIPWEGFTDHYRDGMYNGGLLSFSFLAGWYNGIMYDSLQRNRPVVDGAAFGNSWLFEIMSHPLDSAFWEDRRADWDNLKVPLYSAANWNGWDWASHLKGNLDGFSKAASKHKKLEVHTGHYTDEYYSDRGFEAQRRFFDYWLKGENNGVMDEAPIKLAIRRSVADPDDYFWRDEQEWPLARTQYKRFYLGANEGYSLSRTSVAEASEVGYSSQDGSIEFLSTPFTRETEITGEVLAKLWVSSTVNDMNLHASLIIVHPDGVEEILTKGRLRASMRRLDEEKSTPSQPYHRFDRKEMLEPGEIVELAVEIWPTSMVFQKGSRVKLRFSATDKATRTGKRQELMATNWIHFGGEHPSYLQLPFVPAK